MSEATPTLPQLLARMREGILGDFLVCLPARVEAYDKDRQCVDATPVNLVREEQEDGSFVTKQMETVVSAPVTFPGSGPFRITFPIKVGSTVILQFTSANLAYWLSAGAQALPPDERRHDVCSALAYPGGHSFGGDAAPSTEAPDDALVIHGEKLRLGGPAANDPVIRKSDLDPVVARLNGAIARIEGHTHTGVTTGGGTSGTPLGGTPASAVSSIAAPPGSSVTRTL